MEESINKLLINGRKVSDQFLKQGKKELADAILQLTSTIALQGLQFIPTYKVTCRTCSRQLHVGQEIEFWKHTDMCYSCDSGYSDSLDQNI